MQTAVVLFTRDLRLHDNPALAAAEAETDEVVRLFVRDPAFPASARRVAFLERLLAEVPGLRVVEGDVVEEIERLAPDAVFAGEDASPYARRRERRLAERFDLRLFPGTTVVPLGDLKTYRVFTPYHRAWQAQPWRPLAEAPADARETEARRALDAFLATGRDGSSRLSPYLHFGALSPLECALRAETLPAFARSLAWRDFYLQLLHGEPDRFALGDPGEGGERFAAWREGRTGYTLVDAGMRQLREEGWLPNRVRMVVASFLVHDLELDWRLGARVFEELLLDADVAQNRGNWLWVLANTRRTFNPVLQAGKLAGYVERWAPEPVAPVIAEDELAVRRRRASPKRGTRP